MAKKGSSSSSNSGGGRGHSYSHNPTANASLSVLRLSPIPPLLSPYEPLVEVEDRRLFHFQGPDAPALDIDGRPARVTVRNRNRPKRHKPQAYRFGPKVHSQTKGIITFEAPDRVAVCIRRKRRKEVLFAKRKAGRGGNRPPRRTWLSKISCR